MMYRLFSLLLICCMMPISIQMTIKPKSCLQAKELKGASNNGFYVIYDSLNRPFTTFCDFNSDVGFVWTLIESLSLANAKKSKYRKSFYYDVSTSGCSINWSEFRLCKSVMKSIADARGSTHFRATCNFNIEDIKGINNHRDYLRVSFCNYPNFFKNVAAHFCTKMDYVNIRGHTCRQCSIPLYDGGSSYHILLQVDHAKNICDKWVVPNTVVHDFAFGDYRYMNSKFTCANSSTSITNWWIGGAYIS
ncbi:hypothetical protein TrispH2_008126 [Trichoplax sp. H2]|nr:hypothetical protein TrispH2_008126 [Trichoplax sp. H2]|eukprot:RDD39591.1 hypothetical protein TrispH2_008126 [Trichoplax sp. H2]